MKNDEVNECAQNQWKAFLPSSALTALRAYVLQPLFGIKVPAQCLHKWVPRFTPSPGRFVQRLFEGLSSSLLTVTVIHLTIHKLNF